jgi:hypothetical protein
LSLNSVATQGSVFRLLMPEYTQREPMDAHANGAEDNSVY